MITKQQANQIRRAINKLLKTSSANDWKGAGDPADTPEIEADLDLVKATTKLNALLAAVTEKART